MALDKLMLVFLEDCKTRGMSSRSLPGYKSALKMYGQYLEIREDTISWRPIERS
jgi:site-specific recombinase XerC